MKSTLTSQNSCCKHEEFCEVSVYEKHTNLTKFLMLTTGVSEEVAENDACRIEHIISKETFKGIKKYVKDHKEQL